MYEERCHEAVPSFGAGGSKSLNDSYLWAAHLWISIEGRGRNYHRGGGQKRLCILGGTFLHERGVTEDIAKTPSIDDRVWSNPTYSRVLLSSSLIRS